MTASVSSSVTADILHAEFPLLVGQEHLGVSFQVRPEDAPAAFPERAYGVGVSGKYAQANTGSFYASYKNVLLCLSLPGLKLVEAYTKQKVTPKGPRRVVYFWFAPEDDSRNFESSFLTYAQGEFERLVSHVYVTGESFTNENGPACIVLKGVALCPAYTALDLVEGVLVSVDGDHEVLDF